MCMCLLLISPRHSIRCAILLLHPSVQIYRLRMRCTIGCLEFLDDRVHCTKFGGIISAERRINASIVQGSGIGPVSYVICASDLRALHTGNAFDKYADDSYLIVPSINSSTIPDEFRHISDWASANNLKLNTNKTKEMIFHRPRVNSQRFPPPLDGITRVTTMNVLGVHIQSNLSFRDQVDHLVRQSAQTMYALRILRHHGLCGPPLWEGRRGHSYVTPHLCLLSLVGVYRC